MFSKSNSNYSTLGAIPANEYPKPKHLVAYVGTHGRVIALGLDFEPPLPISDPYTAHVLPLDSSVAIGQPLPEGGAQ